MNISNINWSFFILIVAILSLIWNMYFLVKSRRKKIKIKCFKSKSKDVYKAYVTLTNFGEKPIYIRRIELYIKKGKIVEKKNINYNQYKEQTKFKPLNSEEWREVQLTETECVKFFDENERKFYKSKLIVVDTKGKEYKTKWFRQNNIR